MTTAAQELFGKLHYFECEDLGERIAEILCETEEDTVECLRVLEEGGYRWASGHALVSYFLEQRYWHGPVFCITLWEADHTITKSDSWPRGSKYVAYKSHDQDQSWEAAPLDFLFS